MDLENNEQHNYYRLCSLGFREKYPYVENGVEGFADNLYTIYFKAIFSYQTFSIIEDSSKHYSLNEQKIIKYILDYQREIDAYYAPFEIKSHFISPNYSELTSTQIKDRLNKAYRKNRGIYYVAGLNAYTSSTLHENPMLIKGQGRVGHDGCGMYRKKRLFGRLEVVVPKTLLLFSNATVQFQYPYVLKGVEGCSDNIYTIYALAYEYGKDFEITGTRQYYSSNQKRIIRQLRCR